MSRQFVDCQIRAGWIIIKIGEGKKRWTDLDHVFDTDNNALHEELKKLGIEFHDDRQAIIDTCKAKKPGEKKEQPTIDIEEKKNKIMYVLQQKHDGLTPLALEVLTQLTIKARREATELIVKEILFKEHVYTTRDDERAEMWIYVEGIYVPQARTYIKEICRSILGDAYTTSIGNEVISKIEADTYIEQDEFFDNKNIEEIAIENGILNLTTRKLSEFTPEKKFFNKLPVKYDEDAECPSITKHFKTVLKYEEDLPVIEEIFGYLLLREYKFEKAFMFIGTGRNGKSKTLELMKRFLGIDNCASIPLQQLEDDNFAMGELFNKMANIAGDLDKKSLKHTGSFKTLTGRDLISAARKFLTRVKFTNYAKLIFACNDLPITYDLSLAFFSRWIVLEFPFIFVDQKEFEEIKEGEEKKKCRLKDPDIIEKIATPEELSGLLNIAINGLHRILDNGGFSYSKNTDEVKRLWMRKSSSFNAFIMDCIKEDWESTVEKAELRKIYAGYCRNHKLTPASDKAIKTILSENFGVSDERESIDGIQKYIWRGIRFRQGCYTCYGFSPLGKEESKALDMKHMANIATLTSFEENGEEKF